MASLKDLGDSESTSLPGNQDTTIRQNLPSTTIGTPMYISFTESPLVNVKIGTDSRVFAIHKDKLIAQSAFFKSRFHFIANSGGIDAESHKISLDDSGDHDADAFACIADWIYEGKAVLSKVANEPVASNDYNAKRRAQVMLTKVYIEGDILIMPVLKNQIVDEISALSNPETLPSLEALHMLKSRIPHDSNLERYLFDLLTYWLHTRPDRLKYNKNGWHIEARHHFELDNMLAFKVMSRLCEYKSSQNPLPVIDPRSGTGCKYHEHDAGAPADECSAKK